MRETRRLRQSPAHNSLTAAGEARAWQDKQGRAAGVGGRGKVVAKDCSPPGERRPRGRVEHPHGQDELERARRTQHRVGGKPVKYSREGGRGLLEKFGAQAGHAGHTRRAGRAACRANKLSNMRRGGGSSCPRHPRPETHLGRFAARRPGGHRKRPKGWRWRRVTACGSEATHLLTQGARRGILGHRGGLGLWSDGS